jgi:hypothetical protein
MNWPQLDLPRRLFRPARPGGGTLLGLGIDGSRLEGVVVRRSNGSAEIAHAFSANLALDPLEADPVALGREIRQHLDAAGVRERRCVVAVPLSWLFTLSLPLPELPEADLESLIQLEAERGFPSGPETLVVARSRYRTPAGAAGVTLLGLSRQHVTRIETALRAAHLRLVSITLGLAALPGLNGEAAEGVVMLVPGEQAVGLQVTCGGGMALLRTLAAPTEPNVAAVARPDPLARELRITLGQLPPEVGEAVRCVRVVGAGPAAENLAGRLRERFAESGLRIEWIRELPPESLGVKLPAGTGVSLPLAVAVRHLAQKAPAIEFLPPKVSRWQALTAKYTTSRTVALATLAAGAVVLLVVVAFGVQQARLMYWRAKWNGMRAQVTELEAVQQRVRQFRPWYDESFRSLTILRRLTEAFPEDGTVSAKSVEIRPGTGVTCTGTARDQAALLRVREKLQALPEVRDLKVVQIRGNAPMQFTVNFQWTESGSP